MPLPELIEIVPMPFAVNVEMVVPGSKSITNRALILAALGKAEMVLEGALWSEDTQVMVECLKTLGITIRVEPDRSEPANRRITVRGEGGKFREGGTAERPLDLFVGNAGTAARFLAAFVTLGRGAYRLQGVARMHERPQAALFRALRELGYRIDSANDKLPAIIHGGGPKGGSCTVSIAESSQFASALLLAASAASWKVQIVGENAEESPYVAMTSALVTQFSAQPLEFQVEPDASSASYIWGAGWLLGEESSVQVANWPRRSLQIDARFPEVISRFPRNISRLNDLGDSIMTAIVLAPFATETKVFTDLGRLRVQECERVMALRTELLKCGADVIEEGDTLTIQPSRLKGATIETYNDHRMAMCFATVGLKVPGIKIKNPSCVNKTFPNFFSKLAAPAPHGLGVRILNEAGRELAPGELIAE